MTETHTKTPGQKALKLLLIFAGIGLVVAALFAFAPKGFDLDLNQVGNAKPALVFIYDANLGVSSKQAAIINQVRDTLDKTTKNGMHFLMAKIGRPDAKVFIEQHNVRAADLVLLDKNGNIISVTPGLVNAKGIKAMVDTAMQP